MNLTTAENNKSTTQSPRPLSGFLRWGYILGQFVILLVFEGFLQMFLLSWCSFSLLVQRKRTKRNTQGLCPLTLQVKQFTSWRLKKFESTPMFVARFAASCGKRFARRVLRRSLCAIVLFMKDMKMGQHYRVL